VTAPPAKTHPPRVKPAQPIEAFALDRMVVPALSFEHDGVCVLDCVSNMCTAVVALAPRPHVVRFVPSFVLSSVARSSSGQILAAGRASGTPTNRLFALDLETGDAREIAPPRGWRHGPVRLIALGEDVLAVPTSSDRAALGYDGLLLDSGRSFTLPPPPWPGAFAGIDAHRLGDGSALVIAGTTPFRWDADAVVRLEAIASMVVGDLGGAPQGMLADDGALLLCAGDDRSRDGGRVVVAGEREQTQRLRSLAPSGEYTVVAPSLERAYLAMAGPDGAVVVKQHEPPEKDLCKVYWHREKLVASVPRAWLGLKKHAHDVVYSSALRALVVTQLHRAPSLFVVPWSDVARLPRTPL
jgi:hypothetical protein